MTISFSTKGNLKSLIKKLDNINKDFDSGEFLEDTAKLLNSSIQTRVQKKGEGIDGKKMRRNNGEPYSMSYVDFRLSKGRQVLLRDLTYSGKMWQSLTTSKRKNQANMFFGNAESINKASGNQAKIPFFGLGSKERILLKKEIDKLIKSL